MSRSMLLNQRRIFILPSSQGALFLLIALVVFIGGINYANSLILAVAFLMISLFIVCILHTYANLSGLRISAGRSVNCFAGNAASFEVIVSRDNNRTRSYHAISLCWAEGEGEGQASDSIDLLDVESSSQWLDVASTQRGLLLPPRLRVESRYPLGLLKAWTSIQLDQQCVVYPRPQENELQTFNSGTDGDGHVVTVGNNDFESLRAYTPGDNPRHIAWKHYARGTGLQSKVFVDHSAENTALDWEALPNLGVEQRLSALCYWALYFSERQEAFSLRLPQVFIAEAIGDSHRQQCLEALALFSLTDVGQQKRRTIKGEDHQIKEQAARKRKGGARG